MGPGGVFRQLDDCCLDVGLGAKQRGLFPVYRDTPKPCVGALRLRRRTTCTYLCIFLQSCGDTGRGVGRCSIVPCAMQPIAFC